MVKLKMFLCILLINSGAFANPLHVLMIDAGTPNVQHGNNISLDRMKAYTHMHSDAMYQFITDGIANDIVVDWCIIFHGNLDMQAYIHCLSHLNEYDIVNMSIAGEDINLYELMFLLKASRPLIVIAAGNEGIPRHLALPARVSYIKRNIIPISAIDNFGTRLPSSNWDDNSIDYIGVEWYRTREGKLSLIRGTSVAAAKYSNHLIKVMTKKGK